MSLSLQLGLVYLISEMLLTVTRRSRSRTRTKQDRSTLRILWLVIMASVAAGVYVARSTSLRAGYLSVFALLHGQMFALLGVFPFVSGLLLTTEACLRAGWTTNPEAFRG